MRKNFTLLFLLIFFIPLFVNAQAPLPPKKKGKRPKVGLVLSGGGAKGFAYIGLFKVLKEVGLHIDYVAGTSIGSIMAGFYAAGYDPDSLPAIIRSQDWDAVMKDGIDRKYVSYVDKELGSKLVITLPIEKGGKGVSLMSSLSEGQNVDLLLNRFFGSQYKVRDFSKLPIPFFCVATDLFTGNAVVLDTGNLVQAIRASMSIPGYFNPVHMGDKYLVDGGVVNNYPVMEVKKRGVDFVVGGDVQQGLAHDINKLKTVTDVIMQVTGYHALKATEEGLKNTDLYIHFDMGSYDMMSFNDYDSIMAIGERTARAHYDELKALADSLNAIEFVPGNEFAGKPLDSVNVYNVVVTGNKKVPLKYFHNMLKKIKRHKVSIHEIEETVKRMYGSGFFKHVTYQLDDAGGGMADVIIGVDETGLGELAAGVHYDSDYQGALMVNAMFRNLLIHGSKLFVNLQLGNSLRLRTMFIMDRGPKPGFGLASDFYEFKFGYYYDYHNLNNLTSERFNELMFSNYKFTAFANTTFLNQFNLRAGADLEFFSLGQNISDTLLYPYLGFHTYMTLFGEFSFDTRDKAVYPTRGSFFKGRFEYVSILSNNWLKDIFSNSAIFFVNYQGNIGLDRHKRFVLQPGIFTGVLLHGNNPPFQHKFGMGGVNNFQFQDNIVPFVGTEFIQLWGTYAGKVRLKLQYNVYKKIYVIIRDDVGFMLDDPEGVFKTENYINGYGLTLAYNSFIGPIEVTGMSSNITGPSVFFSVGFWF